MKHSINQLSTTDLSPFLTFLKNFILNQFLDYPPNVRQAYWQKDFGNKERLLKELKTNKTRIYVARDKKKIIAFALVKIEPGGGFFLSWLGVDKPYRGQGIESEFLKKVEKVALAEGCHFIYLWTENQNNIRFYKKRGFGLVGLQKQAWYGQDEYLMQKNIRPYQRSRLSTSN